MTPLKGGAGGGKTHLWGEGELRLERGSFTWGVGGGWDPSVPPPSVSNTARIMSARLTGYCLFVFILGCRLQRKDLAFH